MSRDPQDGERDRWLEQCLRRQRDNDACVPSRRNSSVALAKLVAYARSRVGCAALSVAVAEDPATATLAVERYLPACERSSTLIVSRLGAVFSHRRALVVSDPVLFVVALLVGVGQDR